MLYMASIISSAIPKLPPSSDCFIGYSAHFLQYTWPIFELGNLCRYKILFGFPGSNVLMKAFSFFEQFTFTEYNDDWRVT